MIPQPPRPTPFPYTTLFRSGRDVLEAVHGLSDSVQVGADPDVVHPGDLPHVVDVVGDVLDGHMRPRVRRAPGIHRPAHRSEEHTSELQSLTNLVCRLLLEKK